MRLPLWCRSGFSSCRVLAGFAGHWVLLRNYVRRVVVFMLLDTVAMFATLGVKRITARMEALGFWGASGSRIEDL